MKGSDLFRLALAGFARRRGRTILSVLGVSVGTLALLLIVSLGQGMETHIVTQFSRGEAVRQILVRPGGSGRLEKEEIEELEKNPALTGERGERLRRGLLRRRAGPSPRGSVRIYPETLDEVASLENVERVDPLIVERVQLELDLESDAEKRDLIDATMVAASGNPLQYTERLVAGRAPEDQSFDEALLHEVFLFHQGFESEGDQANLIGRRITVSVSAVAARFPGAQLLEQTGMLDRLSPEERALAEDLISKLGSDEVEEPEPYSAEFTVVGIIGEPEAQSDVSIFEASALAQADIVLPRARAVSLSMQSPMTRETGFRGMLVVAKTPDDAEPIADLLKEKDLQPTTVGSILGRIRSALTAITLVVALLSAVALLVAALGIVNTMTMSVLERTREIGILKSIGARDSQIRKLFLLEGTLIGVAGGLFGCLLAFALSIPGDFIAEKLFIKETGQSPGSPIFAFPSWLPLGSIALSTLVAIAAAFFPSRRASRIQPVDALRHD